MIDTADSAFKNMGIRYWRALIEEEKNARISRKTEKQDWKNEPLSFSLTERQREILELLTKGLSNKEIANKICLSPRTVDMHVRNIFDRMNCRSRAEATKIALENNVLG